MIEPKEESIEESIDKSASIIHERIQADLRLLSFVCLTYGDRKTSVFFGEEAEEVAKLFERMKSMIAIARDEESK